jgi:hypothetical protein
MACERPGLGQFAVGGGVVQRKPPVSIGAWHGFIVF